MRQSHSGKSDSSRAHRKWQRQTGAHRGERDQSKAAVRVYSCSAPARLCVSRASSFNFQLDGIARLDVACDRGLTLLVARDTLTTLSVVESDCDCRDPGLQQTLQSKSRAESTARAASAMETKTTKNESLNLARANNGPDGSLGHLARPWQQLAPLRPAPFRFNQINSGIKLNWIGRPKWYTARVVVNGKQSHRSA